MKISKSTIIGIFFAGMLLGYIGSLWHQAAQKAHRLNCPACREYVKTDYR